MFQRPACFLAFGVVVVGGVDVLLVEADRTRWGEKRKTEKRWITGCAVLDPNGRERAAAHHRERDAIVRSAHGGTRCSKKVSRGVPSKYF